MSTKSIDWSKAPEGATHFEAARDESECDVFWRVKDGVALQVWRLIPWKKDPSEQFETFTYGPKGCDYFDASRAVARPAPWSGEGLPPVGSVCEMLSHGEEESEWIDVQILAHTKINGEDHAVFQYEGHVGTGSVQGSCFRPVRTDQERGIDLVLSEIEALYAEGGPAAIYDAGYRKIDPAGAQP